MAALVPSTVRARKPDPPSIIVASSEAAAGGDANPASSGGGGGPGVAASPSPTGQSGPDKLKRVGDWLLGETLGQGSFGKVKLAHHVKTLEKVAVKIVDKSGIANVEDVERVYRETFILTTLKHTNIIKLFEVLDTPKSILLVMEYAGGGELFSYVAAKHRLDEVESCRLFQQIIAGVEYCHRAKIIHRDLKLENILLDKSGQVKIADFGLSNSIKFGQKMDTSCGTPSYTCPEQINGKKYVGSSADIWSLGCILFAMLSGFLPFESQGIPALFRKIKQRQYKCPDYLSREAVDIIDRMLTLDPEKRASLSELRNHPWMLMEYTELAEQIEAMPPVTPEMVSEARAQCMAVGDEQAQAAAAAATAHAANQAQHGRHKYTHSKSNSGPAGLLVNGVSSGKALSMPNNSTDSLPSASPSPTPDDAVEGKDGSLSADRDSTGREGYNVSNSSSSSAGGMSAAAQAGMRPRERGAPGHASMGGAPLAGAGGIVKPVPSSSGGKGFRDVRNGAQPPPTHTGDRYSPSTFSLAGSGNANVAAAAAATHKARSLSIFDKLSVRTVPDGPIVQPSALSAGTAGGGAPLANSRYPRFSPNPGGQYGGGGSAGGVGIDDGRVRFPPIGASPPEPHSGGGSAGVHRTSVTGGGAAAAAAARAATSHGGRGPGEPGAVRMRRPSEFASGAGIPSYMQPTENAQNHLLASEREEREKQREAESGSAARRARGSVISTHITSPPGNGKRMERAGLGASGVISGAVGDAGDFYSPSPQPSPGLRAIGGATAAGVKTPRARDLGAPPSIPAYMLETNSSRQRGGSKVADL